MCSLAVSTFAVRSGSAKLAAQPRFESFSSDSSWVTSDGMIIRTACGNTTSRIAWPG